MAPSVINASLSHASVRRPSDPDSVELTVFSFETDDPNGDIEGIVVERVPPTGDALVLADMAFEEEFKDIYSFPVTFSQASEIGTHKMRVTLMTAAGDVVSDTSISLATSHPASVSLNAMPTTLVGVGDSVTLSGSNLDTVKRVLVGGVPAEVTNHSPTSLDVEIPVTGADHTVSLEHEHGLFRSDELRIKGELFLWDTIPDRVQAGSLIPLPISYAGVDGSQVDAYVNDVLGGNESTGFANGLTFQAPKLPTPAPVTIRIEFPEDPATGTPWRIQEFELRVVAACTDIGDTVPSADATIPVSLVDDRGLMTVEGQVEMAQVGASVRLDAKAYPSSLPMAAPPGGGRNLLLAELSSPSPFNQSDLRWSFKLPSKNIPGVQAYFLPPGGSSWDDLNPTSDGQRVDGVFPDRGTILIRVNDSLLPSLNGVFSGLSNLSVPPELNVKDFGPQSAGSPSFANLVKEGSVLPVLVEGDFPPIDEVRVVNASVLALDDAQSTPTSAVWSTSTVPYSGPLAAIATFGPIKQNNPTEFGFTLQLNPLTDLDNEDILVLELAFIEYGPFGNERVFDMGTADLAVFGLPEIIVEAGDPYPSPFDHYRDVFTTEGRRIDGFLEEDGCINSERYGCEKFIGANYQVADCSFEDTGCYSTVNVGPGAVLGVGRPLSTVNEKDGGLGGTGPVDISSLEKFETFAENEFDWATVNDRGPDVGIFSTLVDGIRLFVTGQVRVEKGGLIYLRGMRGISADSTGMDDPQKSVGRMGGVAQRLDRSLAAEIAGGYGTDGGQTTSTQASWGENPDPTDIRFRGLMIDFNTQPGQASISFPPPEFLPDGGVGITSSRGASNFFEVLSTSVSLLSSSWEALSDPKDMTIAKFFGFDFSKDDPVDVGDVLKIMKNILEAEFPTSNKSPDEILKIFGLGPLEVKEGLNTKFGKFLSAANGGKSTEPTLSQATGVIGETDDGLSIGGEGGFVDDGAYDASRRFFNGRLYSGRSGTGGAGGGGSVAVQTLPGVPLFGTVTVSSKEASGGGGGGGGAGGGALTISAGQMVVLEGAIDASGGEGGHGHPQVFQAGPGGGGSGAWGGKLIVKAPFVVNRQRLDVSGGEGGVGLSIMNKIPRMGPWAQTQVLHGLQEGSFVQHEINGPGLQFTFPDGRLRGSLGTKQINALLPGKGITAIAAVGEAYDARGPAGLLVVDDRDRIVRLGYPNFDSNSFIGEPVVLESDISLVSPAVHVTDITQDPSPPHDIFVSGWRNERNPSGTHLTQRDAVIFRLTKNGEADGADGVPEIIFEEQTANQWGFRLDRFIRQGFFSGLDFLSNGKLFGQLIPGGDNKTTPAGSGWYEIDKETGAKTLVALHDTTGDVSTSVLRRHGAPDRVFVGFRGMAAWETENDPPPERAALVRSYVRLSMFHLTEFILEGGSAEQVNEATPVWVSTGKPGAPGNIRVDGLTMCSKNPRAVVKYLNEDKFYSQVIVNPAVSSVNGSTWEGARDLVLDDTSTEIVVEGVGFDYGSGAATLWLRSYAANTSQALQSNGSALADFQAPQAGRFEMVVEGYPSGFQVWRKQYEFGGDGVEDLGVLGGMRHVLSLQ